MFTTLSFITGLYSAYLFYIKEYKLSSILYLISYWFDTIDGHYARKYNMQSNFGDYYDHVTDVLVYLIFVYLIYINNDMPIFYKKYALVIFIIVMSGTSYHFGCVQQKNKNDKRYLHSETIQAIDFKKCDDKLATTSIFNAGTIVSITCIYIYLHDYFKL